MMTGTSRQGVYDSELSCLLLNFTLSRSYDKRSFHNWQHYVQPARSSQAGQLQPDTASKQLCKLVRCLDNLKSANMAQLNENPTRQTSPDLFF